MPLHCDTKSGSVPPDSRQLVGRGEPLFARKEFRERAIRIWYEWCNVPTVNRPRAVAIIQPKRKEGMRSHPFLSSLIAVERSLQTLR